MSGSAPGWGSWTIEPIAAIVAIGACWWYAGAYRRVRRRSGRPPGVTWWVPFAAGVALLALATLSPLAAIADGWLLTASTLQHVLISDVSPALMLLGMRAPLLAEAGLRPRGRWASRLEGSKPAAVAIPLWIAVTWLWAVPAVADLSAEHAAIGMLSHLTLMASGFALWWLIVDPLPGAQLRPNGQRMALLAATHVASACVCLPLLWLSHVQYALFAGAPRAFGLSAITDQHAAGGLMSLIEFLVFGLAFAGVFISVLTRADAGETLAAGSAAPAGTPAAAPAGAGPASP